MFWTRGFCTIVVVLFCIIVLLCGVINELIVKFNKQQLSGLFIRDSSHLKPYLPQTAEKVRPHSSNCIESVTP